MSVKHGKCAKCGKPIHKTDAGTGWKHGYPLPFNESNPAHVAEKK